MSLIASTTNTGLSIKQTVAPTVASNAAAAKNATKKVAVEDSMDGLRADLVGLKKNIANISSIKVSDAGALSFTAEELTKYSDVIAKISGNREFTATAVDATTLDSVLKNKNVTKIQVKDTAANIGNKIGSLIANNARVTQLNVSDNEKMAVTYSNFSLANASGGLFSKLVDGAGTAALTALNGKLNVSGVSVANYSSLNTGVATSKVNSATISDTLSNIVAASASLNTDTTASKITKVNLVSKGATSITSSDYTAFKLKTDLNKAIDPNALKEAFAVTGVTAFADVAPGTALANDINVKSITVSSSISTLPAITSLSSKVTKVDVSGTRAHFEAAGVMDKMAALGSKLGKVTITDATTVTVAASDIRRKDVAVALAKTVGTDAKAIGAAVTGANLADVNGLLANKQVSSAAISDTAKNMLKFSADKFAMLNNAANVTITIEDNATNVSKYHTELKNAVSQFNSSKIKLTVTDTAANIAATITNLDEVATAVSSTYDNARIKIKQVYATGALDVDSKIKVDLTTYNSSRDVLQYVADATGMTRVNGAPAQHVELDTDFTSSATSILNARNISATLTTQKYVDATLKKAKDGDPLLTAGPTFAINAAYSSSSAKPVPDNATGDDVKFNGTAKYEDVAQINIKLSGLTADKLKDYTQIQSDAALMKEDWATVPLTPVYGLRTGVKLNVMA